MTSVTSCIVGKKIKAMGPGPLELFPLFVLAILMAMAGGISEHMLTSWSSLFSMTRVKDHFVDCFVIVGFVLCFDHHWHSWVSALGLSNLFIMKTLLFKYTENFTTKK